MLRFYYDECKFKLTRLMSEKHLFSYECKYAEDNNTKNSNNL